MRKKRKIKSISFKQIKQMTVCVTAIYKMQQQQRQQQQRRQQQQQQKSFTFFFLIEMIKCDD